MANFLGYTDGYDEEGNPRSVGLDELHSDTVHPQGTSKVDLEIDFVGSSTVKNLNPNGTTTNTPTNEQLRIPVGARVENGLIIVNG